MKLLDKYILTELLWLNLVSSNGNICLYWRECISLQTRAKGVASKMEVLLDNCILMVIFVQTTFFFKISLDEEIHSI